MSYEPVSIHTMVAQSTIPFSIYVKLENKYSTVLEKGDVFSPQLKTDLLLLDEESDKIYIHKDSWSEYTSYMRLYLNEHARDKSIPFEDRSRLVYYLGGTILEEVFRDPYCADSFRQSQEISENVAYLVMEQADTLWSLIEAGSQDYTTYNHSVDVALFATGFGDYLNMDIEDLKKLSFAALMHDIGKSRLDQDILHKNGKINNEEFTHIKDHSVYGEMILKEHGVNDEDILKGVRHHHEKEDGSGYPDNLKGKDTSLFAKIISIADIFSAITTDRSYKQACSSYETLLIMKNKMSHEVDNKLLQEFIKFQMGIATKKGTR